MMKRIRNFIAASLLILSIGLGIAVPVSVHAQDAKTTVCESIGAGPGCAGTGGGGTSVNQLITLIINTFSLVIGVVAVIMIMVSGFRYITSGGDANKVSGAKNTLVYAVIGLVVVALAQVIVRFVIGKVK